VHGLHGAGEGQPGQQRGQHGVGGRRREQQRAPGPPVGHEAAVQAQQEHRQELARHRDADGGRAAGQLEDEPVLCDRAHPRAGGGGGEAREVDPVGGGAEGGEGRGHEYTLSS